MTGSRVYSDSSSTKKSTYNFIGKGGYKGPPLSFEESWLKAWDWLHDSGLSSFTKILDCNKILGNLPVEKPSCLCRYHRYTMEELKTNSSNAEGCYVSLKTSTYADGEIQPYSFAVAFKGFTTHFGLYWQNIIDIVYYMSQSSLGNMQQDFIMKSDFFFIQLLWEKLEKEQKEKNEREQKRAEEEAKMYEQQRAMMNNNNLSSMMNNSGFSMPQMPQIPKI